MSRVSGATVIGGSELILNVSVRGGTRTLLDRVTLDYRAGEFYAILGPSGSGKSTLVKLLCGLLRPTGGQIQVRGEPLDAIALMTAPDIAYLPQDVVLHETLAVNVALDYAARARLPDLDAVDRQACVQRTLDRVGLADRASTRIDRLSGGQRKRIGLAAQLLGNPSVLILDEATSGLDPATEAEMMELFRSLADEGKAVLCVTHHTNRLSICDRLDVLQAGKLLASDTPDRILRLFGVPRFDDLYGCWQKLGNTVDSTVSLQPSQPATILPIPPRLDHRPAPFGDQLADGTSRLLRLIISERGGAVAQVMQGPIIAAMIGLTFGDIRGRFAEQEASDTKQVFFLMVLAVLWCGGTGSVREIVKEIAIIRQELRTGLRLPAYLLAKLLVLGGLAAVQAVLLLLIVRALTHLSGPLPEQILGLILTAFAGSSLGLLISAGSSTSERALHLLPVQLIGLAIFSGGLAHLSGSTDLIAKCISPAFWSMEAMKSTMRTTVSTATHPGSPGTFQHPILGTGLPLALDCVVLFVMIIIGMVFCHRLLSRRLHRV